MKTSPARPGFLLRSIPVFRVAAVLTASALFVPTMSAALVPPGTVSVTKLKVVSVAGAASTTLTSVVFNDNGTISIDAVQTGSLSHFGDFTGEFSYLAIPSPTSILLQGTAVLTNRNGEQLRVNALILELGADYPYAATGVLNVTGGTGRFAGAAGLIGVTGTDTASPTDTLNLQGTLILAK